MTRRLSPLLLFAVGAVGCAPPPTVTKGTFTGSHTLTIQRGSAEVVVKANGPASYVVTNYAMDHTMGQRPDTEATFTTSAGTFVITDKGNKDGMTINGKQFPTLGAGSGGRITVTIDEQGAITMTDSTPKEQEPKADPPGKE